MFLQRPPTFEGPPTIEGHLPFFDPCPNGAAYYLYVAGIVLLASNLVFVLATCYPITYAIGTVIGKFVVLCDGTVSCGEKCYNSLVSLVPIADVVLLIWVSLA